MLLLEREKSEEDRLEDGRVIGVRLTYQGDISPRLICEGEMAARTIRCNPLFVLPCVVPTECVSYLVYRSVCFVHKASHE